MILRFFLKEKEMMIDLGSIVKGYAAEKIAEYLLSLNLKSTLIDIIMDPEKYLFDGKLEMEPNLKIGYVSQFSQCDKSEETTVFK